MGLSNPWFGGGTFLFSYNISSSTTTGHNIRNYVIANSNWPTTRAADITVTVNSGIFQGDEEAGTGAPNNTGILTGNPWPTGSALKLINNGNIYGAGGDAGSASAGSGEAGGTGINLQYPMTIQNNGVVAGGGGGGGGGRNGNPTSSPTPPSPGGESDPPSPNPPSTNPGGAGGGGGGGRGYDGGFYGTGNQNGTSGSQGGAGSGGSGGHNAGPGGAGGGLGTAGSAGSGSPQGGGGAAGAAGYYLISNGHTATWSATGTRTGQVS
jgi:hypothetical protein